MVARDVCVPVPASFVFHAARIDLHKPNAAFDQPPCRQTLLGKMSTFRIVQTVQLLSRLRFVRQIQGFGSRHLHSIRQLERFNPSGKLGFSRVSVKVLSIKASQKVQLRPLLSIGHLACPFQVLDRITLWLQGGSLEDAGQEACTPILSMSLGDAAP